MPRLVWTIREEKLLRKEYQKLNNKQLAAMLDKRVSSIEWKMQHLKLSRRRHRIKTPPQVEVTVNPLTISMAMYDYSTKENVTTPAKLHLHELFKIVCGYFNLTPKEVLSRTRKKEIVKARHFFSYIGYTNMEYSLPALAHFLGFDHTSIIHARDTIANELNAKYENVYQADYRKIMAMC